MIKKQFKCRLLTDVILSTSAATEGKRESLDFIPGGCFLGIAASQLYFNGQHDEKRLDNEDSLLAFHSGKVKFGDAHPVKDGIRTVKMPAAYYHPKLQKESDGCVILYNWEEDPDIQMKQCRKGFYAFNEEKLIAEKVRTDKAVSIKSAYDGDRRCARDESMYSYEALCKGAVFAFEVEFDDKAYELVKSISDALCGTKHIGKSKTAEYGLVEIQESGFKCTESHSGQENATVYADGRLIFLDENGLPEFTPEAEDLGFQKGAEIDWDKTQIRTFQYAPWNAKRQNSDCDRCGIEKGSVFVVKLNGTESPETNAYIGSYKNEGFGKVIYNPEFLSAKEGSNGEVKFELRDASPEKTDSQTHESAQSVNNSTLLTKLKSIKKNSGSDSYSAVNKFVAENRQKFVSGESFASQWGHIRELAERAKSKEELKSSVTAYLGHGVAEEKWRYKKDVLITFINNLDANNWKESMVNLAAVMAKKCKKN